MVVDDDILPLVAMVVVLVGTSLVFAPGVEAFDVVVPPRVVGEEQTMTSSCEVGV